AASRSARFATSTTDKWLVIRLRNSKHIKPTNRDVPSLPPRRELRGREAIAHLVLATANARGSRAGQQTAPQRACEIEACGLASFVPPMHQEDRVVGANYYSAKISLMLGGSIRPGVQRMLAKSWTFSLSRVKKAGETPAPHRTSGSRRALESSSSR